MVVFLETSYILACCGFQCLKSNHLTAKSWLLEIQPLQKVRFLLLPVPQPKRKEGDCRWQWLREASAGSRGAEAEAQMGSVGWRFAWWVARWVASFSWVVGTHLFFAFLLVAV